MTLKFQVNYLMIKILQTPRNCSMTQKLYVPKHPTYNFIGRILGPCGNSVRRLEEITGCRILIRGKGSVKVSTLIRALR